MIQTGKLRHFPVILFGTEYWQGMIDWIRARMLEEAMIAPEDLSLLSLTDSIDESVDTVVRHRLAAAREASTTTGTSPFRRTV